MFVNRTRIRVEFGDCDPANIVYFANYFHWFDRCTTALFQAAGLPLAELFKARGVLVPVVDARARYVVPCSYGDLLVTESRVTECKRSSFTITHRFLRERALVMEGSETRVWAAAHPTEPGRLQSVPLPAEVIEKLSETVMPDRQKLLG